MLYVKWVVNFSNRTGRSLRDVGEVVVGVNVVGDKVVGDCVVFPVQI